MRIGKGKTTTRAKAIIAEINRYASYDDISHVAIERSNFWKFVHISPQTKKALDRYSVRDLTGIKLKN